MAKNKTIYGMSRYARRYVKSGEKKAYGIMISGFRKDEDGENHYVNIWLSQEDGADENGVYLTKGHDGNPWLHIRLAEVTNVERTDEEKKPKKTADKPKKKEVEEYEDDGENPFDDDGKIPF